MSSQLHETRINAYKLPTVLNDLNVLPAFAKVLCTVRIGKQFSNNKLTWSLIGVARAVRQQSRMIDYKNLPSNR